MTFSLNFTPVYWPSRTLTVRVDGDALIINGSRVDFSALEEGKALRSEVPPTLHSLLANQAVHRLNGVVHVTLIQPYGDFSFPYTGLPIAASEGDVELPFPVADVEYEAEPDVVVSTDQVHDPLNDSWETLRTLRDLKLRETDYTQLPDYPHDPLPWQEYRQALRDLPANTSDPRAPEWPDEP